MSSTGFDVGPSLRAGDYHLYGMEASAREFSQLKVRKLGRADLPAVHDLVRELADYERLAGEVVTTVSEYAEDLSAGWFDGLVLEEDGGSILGAMLFYQAYSTWKGRMLYLEDFVISHAYRRRGLGEVLWEQLVEEARRRGCTMIKWQVLEWNDSAKAFYQKMGASLDGGWENGRIVL